MPSKWKEITREAVLAFRGGGMSVVPLHRNALPMGYKLIAVGDGMTMDARLGDAVLARGLRSWLYTKRGTRTVARSDAALWILHNKEAGTMVAGLGQLLSPSHRLVARWERAGGLIT